MNRATLSPSDPQPFGGAHAVVVGGSITGLLAARVLSHHFATVTVIERDHFPTGPEWRKGTPQARHVHVLLKQGERILDRYFPDLLADLRVAGADRVDMAGETRWFHFGGWKARFDSGMDMSCQSRGFLEWKIRSHLERQHNVRILEGHDVTGFQRVGQRLVGVRISARGEDATDRELSADLVVDASGRGTRTPQWLEQLGFTAPPVTEVGVDVGYASRFYRRPRRPPTDWKVLLIYPKPLGTRLGVIIPVEGDRWMVTLVGWFGDHPAADEAGFSEFMQSLPVPDLYLAIRDAEPASPIAVHKFPSNLRRHYERVRTMPEGLIVIGDALCSFNPIYGQGMTTGSMAAVTLDEHLAAQRRRHGAGDLTGFSSRFQRQLARVIGSAWLLTTSEDLRSPQAQGRRPRWIGLLHWYTAKIHRLAWRDPFVGACFLRVMHLTEPATALFHPAVIVRALTAAP